MGMTLRVIGGHIGGISGTSSGARLEQSKISAVLHSSLIPFYVCYNESITFEIQIFHEIESSLVRGDQEYEFVVKRQDVRDKDKGSRAEKNQQRFGDLSNRVPSPPYNPTFAYSYIGILWTFPNTF